MVLMWLYSLCQCILSASVVVVSVRLCMVVRATTSMVSVGGPLGPGSVSCCLRLCLGWVGAIGGAMGVPVSVLLNLRTAQCLYTCIMLVCCPMLIRQFSIFLLILLSLDDHLQHRLAERYALVVTRQRALCVVLLCWIITVLSSFAQFLGTDVLSTWGDSGSGTAGVDLPGNWTELTTLSPPRYHHDRKVIGTYLPYGGFLSKFYVEDMHNFTYAEIHSSHWGVCASDTIFGPKFLVYVHGVTMFLLPLLCLLSLYLDLLCMRPQQTPFDHGDQQKHNSARARFLALSLSLLVLLCLPLYITHTLTLFTPSTRVPDWMNAVASFLFQLYSLVPQILFTPPRKRVEEESAHFSLTVLNVRPLVTNFRGKSLQRAIHEAVQTAPWFNAKHLEKAKVCPEV